MAGISISMLSGDNGLLTRTTEARARTIHANVFEQLQLEELAHLTDKSTSRETSTLIGYLKSKSIIGDEIGEDTGKYQVNVTVLLGSRQSLGNGDATEDLKDVYILEKQSIASGSIVNTKVASTTPVKIALTTTSQVVYKVIYYGNNTREDANLGNLSDSITISTPSDPTGDTATVPQALLEFFIGKEYSVVESIPISGISETWMGVDSSYTDYILYNGKIYAILYENESDDYTIATNITTTDIEPSSLGEKTKDNGDKVFVTAVGEYSNYTDNGDGTYSITENGNIYTYNTSGALVHVARGK